MPLPVIQIHAVKADEPAFENSASLTLKAAFDCNNSTRGDLDHIEKIALKEKDILQFEFEDGSIWVTAPDEIGEVLDNAIVTKRSVTGDTVIDIPEGIYTGEQERGMLKTILLKSLKIFTKTKIGTAVYELAKRAEAAQLGKLRGLLKVDKDFGLSKPNLQEGTTWLLFIHGTASSTLGSFGELKSSADTKLWDYIHKTYPDQVLAFQHETLTQSPLENVLNLLQELPQQAGLHIISHSRGGLVGDILNRFCNGRAELSGFSADEKEYLRRSERDEDVKWIEKIEKVILSKEIIVEKFVRVACPASGTTLASKRLDYLFNILLSLLTPVLGTGAAGYLAIKDLIVGIIETKNNPVYLPGIEAMNPDSPLLQMLNNAEPSNVLASPLYIIAGNSQLSFSWRALAVIASKLFYLNKNDLVVDTRSMYNGARREKNITQYFLDESGEVSHFNYFKKSLTQNALLMTLQSKPGQLVPGFSLLPQRWYTEEEIRNAALGLDGGQIYKDHVSGKRSIVLLLPGIMGSNLSVKDDLVWINYFRFIAGALKNLECSEANNRNVKASSLVATSYKKITENLSRDYDVVTFPFDWRLPLTDSAKLLNNKIIELLQYEQPIKVIAHSMGGVLMRDFMIQHPDTWSQLNHSDKFKLLLLGSPLGGSFRIPYVLFGRDASIKMLDFIDRFHSKKELLSIFSQMPGLLSLLPLNKDDDYDFAQASLWQKMQKATGDYNWPIPDKKLLEEFKTYRDTIFARRDALDYSNVFYVAGQCRPNKETICGFRIEKNTLTFLATREGDESVTWQTGIPQQLLDADHVYFSDITHGELANNVRLFDAIRDIIEKGKTSLLKKTQPLLRGAEKETKAKDVFDFDLSPLGIKNTLLGLATEEVLTSGEVPVEVIVSNGHLRYAAYPLMAGHFLNDGILSAEKNIDEQLGNELSKRQRLGIYPGPIGTSSVLISENHQAFKGALIIGLGNQGELTGYQLTRSVEQGVANYLSSINSAIAKVATEERVQPIGISSLIVGCGYGGLGIETSVTAILQGIQNANEKIKQIYPAGKTISVVEFVELYRDRALTCVHAINGLERDGNRTLNIIWKFHQVQERPGRRERLPVDNTDEWWTRITVRKFDEQVNAVGKKSGLWFTISTDAARAEERVINTSNATVIRMLDDISNGNNWTADKAKAFFELLIPNDFKDRVKRQSNINWIVDKHTAAYPWELLQDSNSNTRPMSVNAGMVRQLATKDFRIQINPVVESNAFVVADPDLRSSNMPQLAGALQEGKLVESVLTKNGYNVSTSLRGDATEILLGLLNKSYKIIHLAGHGVFNTDPNQPSGMLIGENMYLTTSEISQMSITPELVFVNCCYLGQTNAEAEAYHQQFYKLAANIGTQLIEDGVKVVVVAGWAVDDASALAFTERFYLCMFDGDNFGDAVRKARKHVFEEFGYRTNTWGAYQCYGDPFYTLDVKRGYKEPQYEFVIVEEAIIELSNLLNSLETGDYQLEAVVQKMQAIETAIDEAGLGNGRTLELQALIYSALNMYAAAIEKFKKLLEEEKASYSFSALEQYCNLRVRFAVQEHNKPGSRKNEYLKQLKSVIPDLVALKQLSETPERLNILAGTYKRLGMVQEAKTAKKQAYSQAALFYRKALDRNNGRVDLYAFTNWISVEAALVGSGIHKWGQRCKEYSIPTREELVKLVREELHKIKNERQTTLTYWNMMYSVNLLLCLFLLGEKDINSIELQVAYKDAWSRGGSDGYQTSEIEHLSFLEDAFAMANTRQAKPVRTTLRQLKSTLETII